MRLGVFDDGGAGLLLSDLDGESAGGFIMSPDNRVSLSLNSRVSKSAALLNIDKNGLPAFSMFDENGTPRVSLGLINAVEPTLMLWNKHGQPGFILTLPKEGTASMLLANIDTLNIVKNSITLRASEDGVTGLTITDVSGRKRSVYGLSEGGSSFALFDKHGKAGISLSENDMGTSLNLHDKTGFLRATIGLINEKGLLVIRDKNGNPLWVAP